MRLRITPRSGRQALGLSIGLLALLPATAYAHTDAGLAHGFLHGFQHPLLGWDHLLAMVAVGLWAGQSGGRAVWALPAAFVAAMGLGGALGMAELALPGVEAGILASVLVLGALIALAVRLPLAAALSAVALFALFHGHAHGAEMPAAVGGLLYGAGFVSATALLHAAGVALVLLAGRGADVPRPAWLRLAGASIGLAGVALWAL